MDKPNVCEACTGYTESLSPCANDWTWDDVGQFACGFSVVTFWVIVGIWAISREVNKKQ
jgi:hypothetical protein